MTSATLRVALAANRQIEAGHGVVVAQHPAAAGAGAAVLAAGGSVVDAAVAATFGACVADVGRTGIGGYGGHLVYHEAASGQTWLVDFPGRAPMAAHERLFTPEEGPGGWQGWWKVVSSANQTGALAVEVPAVVAGLAAAHARFGHLAWADVLAPAIRLAEEGIHFVAASGRDPVLAEARRMAAFPESLRVFVDAWEGEWLRQPDLARSLRRLAREGSPALYGGSLGLALVEHVRSLGGILEERDLTGYTPAIGLAPGVPYRGCDVYTPGAGSGAGVLAPMLGALDQFDLPGLDPLGAERLALLAAVSGRIWPDRLARAGTGSDGTLAGSDLLEPAYWARVAADVRAGRPGQRVGGEPAGCTSHLVVGDVAGNVVSCTTTLQMLMGSGVTVPGTGIVLNNAMYLFDPRPGRPNSVAPSKPTLTNMCPTIALRDGRPRLAIGASGGRRVPSMVAQAATLMLDHNWGGDRALGASRFHQEGGGPLLLEEGLHAGEVDALRAGGSDVQLRPWASPDLGGQAPALWYADDGRLFGAPDPRRHGAAVAL